MAKKKQNPKPEPKSKPKSAPKPKKEKTVADQNNPQPQPGQQNQPKPVVGGPADDTSVRSLVDKCEELVTDFMSGDYLDGVKAAGSILSVAFDVLHLPNIFGAGAEGGGEVAAALDKAKKSLEECRAKVQAAPQPKGAADPNDLASAVPIDLILQVILAILDAIRNRRKPPAPTP